MDFVLLVAVCGIIYSAVHIVRTDYDRDGDRDRWLDLGREQGKIEADKIRDALLETEISKLSHSIREKNYVINKFARVTCEMEKTIKGLKKQNEILIKLKVHEGSVEFFVEKAVEKCRVVAESNPQMADGAMAAARLIEKMKRQ